MDIQALRNELDTFSTTQMLEYNADGTIFALILQVDGEKAQEEIDAICDRHIISELPRRIPSTLEANIYKVSYEAPQ
jgi:hypothetical protein